MSGYGYSAPTALGVDTTFLNPPIGFLWTWDAGISIGIDAGVHIPLSSTSSSTMASASLPSAVRGAVAAPVQQTMENVAHAVGQTTLPTVDLVKIGMLF